MIFVKLIESGLEDLKRITRADYYLCDSNGEELVSTFEQLNVEKDIIINFADSSAESQNIKGYYFQKIVLEQEDVLILVVYAGGNDGYMLSRIAASEIKHLMGARSEIKDKEEFYKDIILDNILPAEIEKRAVKIKVRDNIRRIVYCVLVDEELTDTALELLKNIFSDNREDMVLTLEAGKIVIVKTIAEDDIEDSIKENAELIVSMINTELMSKARVTYGKSMTGLKNLSEMYKEAVMALEVVSIFYKEKDMASYNSLGIGRLIHQLPENLCKLFLNEVLGENDDCLTKEDLIIIDAFFDNNLNVAETARAIDINRTTLIYRFDKLAKRIGLDIRKFEDALTLKIAMMVARYLEYLEKES